MRTCFLHVGTHKTATTSLQHFLDDNPQVLGKSCYLYPQVGRPDGARAGHHNIAWEISHDRRFRPDYGIAEDLIREIAQSCQNVIVSSEDFECSAHHSERFAGFVEAIRNLGFRVKLILYLRNQLDYAESLYDELIHQGFDQPFSDFCDEILETGAVRWREWIFPFDYESFIGKITTLPDVEIVVRSYDHPSSGSPILDFLSVVGIVTATVAEDLPDKNRRPNLDESIRRYWVNRRQSVDDSDLKEFMDLCSKLTGGSPAMSNARQAQFAEAFNESNRRVCESYKMPRFELTRPGRALAKTRLSLDDIFGVGRRIMG